MDFEKKWTIRPPNVPGYYWVRHHGMQARLVVMAPARNHNGETRLRVYPVPHYEDNELPYEFLSSSDPLFSYHNGTVEWWGPVTVPPTQDRGD
ncbi:hypothetical protein LCGC14_0534260 [marine sediment metagenome]|uniref:Uncharacterized protein n=1 Tax=marine sediment metagenome TaxID=412755 RepID=A0A0F9SD26_9ZZZZ